MIVPSSNASLRMSRQKTALTKPEIDLQIALADIGVAFTVGERILPKSRTRVDIVIPESRIAVLVHGCFWHRCSRHKSIPQTNERFWREKLARNVARDRLTRRELRSAAWRVITAWEHDDMSKVARRVRALAANAP